MKTLPLLAATALLTTGFAATPRPSIAATPDSYADPAAWLCRPGRADACSGELTATVIGKDGTISKHGFTADPTRQVDCFYVYPTVSREPTPNSDRIEGPEETRVARLQLARFGAKCRLFAPLYRQVTLAALHGDAEGDTALAYADVLDAWRSYLARDNHGRGVVLIGHSQGSKILARLLAQEIDGKPVQKQLVSAIVSGAEIGVPAGAAVGGSFTHIPVCEHASQTGCVIGYSSYLASAPPDANARFGGDPKPGETDVCVDPAHLLGRQALQAELPAVGRLGTALGTTFIENPGLILAQCVRSGDRSYLAITIGPGGDVLAAQLNDLQSRLPGWGLHALDINLALGDLVELVGRQSAAWSAQNGGARLAAR